MLLIKLKLADLMLLIINYYRKTAIQKLSVGSTEGRSHFMEKTFTINLNSLIRYFLQNIDSIEWTVAMV